MRRGIIVVGACLLAIAACGSSDGSKPAATSTPDRTVIEAGLLRADDVPGATQSPPSTETTDGLVEAAAGIPECAQFVAVERKGSERRKSPQFLEDGVRVSDSVDAYPSARIAMGQLALYRAPRTPACLEAVLRASLEKGLPATGTHLDAVTATRLPPIAVGDGAFGYRLAFTITQRGQQLELIVDLVGVAIGRSTITLTAGPTTPQLLTTATRRQLTDHLTSLVATLAPRLVARMRAAGA